MKNLALIFLAVAVRAGYTPGTIYRTNDGGVVRDYGGNSRHSNNQCVWREKADCGLHGETFELCGKHSKEDGFGFYLRPHKQAYSKFEYDPLTAENCFEHDYDCWCE